jgi:hypothetical protein
MSVEQPAVGIQHLTVVPENAVQRDHEGEADRNGQ